VALARFGDLGVVVLDRARDDDGIGTRDMLRVVPDMNFRATRAQPLGRGVRGDIRAADLVLQVQQHFGDAAHPGAADADEMDALDLVHQRASSMQRSATVRAASGLPSARALRAIASKAARSIERTSAARRAGESSRCGSATAAPRSARNAAFALW